MAVSSQPLPTPGNHAKRLAKWRNLASPQTRYLIDQVVERLVPAIAAAGFERVDASHMGPDHSPSGSEICLERISGEYLDVITLNFEKHGKPRVQVHGARRQLKAPHAFVRSANLVRRSSQYYYFWGKPWWLPTKLWPESATDQAVEAARQRVGQLLVFLQSNERGQCISKQVIVPPRNVSDRADP